MRKNMVKKLGVMFLAGVMLLSAVGCGKSNSASKDVSKVVASDGESFNGETLDAGQVKLLDKVYNIPMDYSSISKKLKLREEMTEMFNVKVAPNSVLNNVYLDVFNKENSYIVVSLKNNRNVEDLPKACTVTSITAQTGYADSSTILLPGNVSLGSSAYDITGLYGEPDTTIDTKDGFTYIYEKGAITYTFEFVKNIEGVCKITIETK